MAVGVLFYSRSERQRTSEHLKQVFVAVFPPPNCINVDPSLEQRVKKWGRNSTQPNATHGRSKKTSDQEDYGEKKTYNTKSQRSRIALIIYGVMSDTTAGRVKPDAWLRRWGVHASLRRECKRRLLFAIFCPFFLPQSVTPEGDTRRLISFFKKEEGDSRRDAKVYGRMVLGQHGRQVCCSGKHASQQIRAEHGKAFFGIPNKE